VTGRGIRTAERPSMLRPSSALGYFRHAAFGLLVARRRRWAALSQEKLAQRLHWAPADLAGIERGRMPRLDQVYALADAFEVDASDLLHEVRRMAERLASGQATSSS
jgi:transcriptional regulator with XRE-family HTH domain